MKTIFIRYKVNQWSYEGFEASFDESWTNTISFDNVPYEWTDASAAASLLSFLSKNGAIKLEFLDEEVKKFFDQYS
jgi:hypothetical protein